ncbi:hypothetical protein [Jannaschia formosa]|uniref:hypothetical protein n=1 Tax=Jannaschia formosa TaxID=2259592 RepID=UPI0010752DFD|nr:hypothetical protein [Jannaschia formosa]TFL16134.1 hypothetical protein DR046_21670 [Jannaschia formosa]
MIELLEAVNIVLDETSTLVAEARDAMPALDVLQVCVRLERLERRVIQALDTCAGRAGWTSQPYGSDR